LFEHESIRTTEAKAKAAKPLAEKMITLAKRGDLHSRRLALAVLTNKSVTHKLFTDIRERFMERAGGYTSIVRADVRPGDGSQMAMLALVKTEEKGKKAAKKRPRRKKTADKAKAAEAAPTKKEKTVETPPAVAKAAPDAAEAPVGAEKSE